MTQDEIKALIEMAKSMGVRELQVNGFKVVLGPPPAIAVEQDPGVLKDMMLNPASEDETKFWHVGGAGAIGTDGELVTQPLLGDED